jgi:hypothetical protein
VTVDSEPTLVMDIGDMRILCVTSILRTVVLFNFVCDCSILRTVVISNFVCDCSILRKLRYPILYVTVVFSVTCAIPFCV